MRTIVIKITLIRLNNYSLSRLALSVLKDIGGKGVWRVS